MIAHARLRLYSQRDQLWNQICNCENPVSAVEDVPQRPRDCYLSLDLPMPFHSSTQQLIHHSSVRYRYERPKEDIHACSCNSSRPVSPGIFCGVLSPVGWSNCG